MAKTCFATRAHRTAVVRITRRSTLRPRPTFAHNVLELLQKASLCYAFCAPICRSRGFCGKSEPPRGYTVAIQRRREKPNAEPKANVGFLFPSRHCRTTALAKKISQKDFLRRGAASVLSAAFGAVEPPARCAPPRRRQFEKNFVNPFTTFSSGTAPCSSFRTRRPLRACPCRQWCRRRRPPRDRGR